MTRSPSDLAMFSRDLCTDSSLAQHVQRGIEQKSPWLRDSAGLWIRLYSMYSDGEVPIEDEIAAERLRAAVETAFEVFETNHGGHEDFLAAW